MAKVTQIRKKKELQGILHLMLHEKWADVRPIVIPRQLLQPYGQGSGETSIGITCPPIQNTISIRIYI